MNRLRAGAECVLYYFHHGALSPMAIAPDDLNIAGQFVFL